jgi:bacteriocin-like protein
LYGSENACTASFPDVYAQVNEVAQDRRMPEITDEEMANIMGGTATRLYKIDA